jgi:hypothetical protein
MGLFELRFTVLELGLSCEAGGFIGLEQVLQFGDAGDLALNNSLIFHQVCIGQCALHLTKLNF